MSNQCQCETTWRRYGLYEDICWKLDPDVNASAEILDAYDKMFNAVVDMLNSKMAGSIKLETWSELIGNIPGTSTQAFRMVGRYCTTADWFRYRNLEGELYIDDESAPVDGFFDCQPLKFIQNEAPSVINQTCGCTKGPGGWSNNGEELRGNNWTSTGNSATYGVFVELKATWEESTGARCGAITPLNPGPVPQPDLQWTAQNTSDSTTLALKFIEVKDNVRIGQESKVSHFCP